MYAIIIFTVWGAGKVLFILVAIITALIFRFVGRRVYYGGA
jgi:hypothetical protein